MSPRKTTTRRPGTADLSQGSSTARRGGGVARVADEVEAGLDSPEEGGHRRRGRRWSPAQARKQTSASAPDQDRSSGPQRRTGKTLDLRAIPVDRSARSNKTRPRAPDHSGKAGCFPGGMVTLKPSAADRTSRPAERRHRGCSPCTSRRLVGGEHVRTVFGWSNVAFSAIFTADQREDRSERQYCVPGSQDRQHQHPTRDNEVFDQP